MLFTEPHTAYLVEVTTDAYGTITASEEEAFSCIIEKRSRLGFTDSQLYEVGKGIIYTTTNSLAFDTGKELKIDGEVFLIKAIHKAEGLDGEFSHWELTYG